MQFDGDFQDGKFPRSFIRGSFMIPIIIFSSDPTSFLDQQELSWVWNPDYIILFSLDPDLDHEGIVRHKLVQRSKFIVLIRPSSFDDVFLVYNVRHATFDSPDENRPVLRLLSQWETKVSQHKFKLAQKRIEGFERATIGLASFCWDFPFMYVQPDDTCPGAAFDILNILAEKLNFSYTWQMRPSDGEWGSKMNGLWTGMLADLAYDNKSLIINNFLLTFDRKEGFDITYPYFSEGFSFILKVPDPAPKWKGLLYPFSSFVWMCVLVTSIGTSVLLTAALYLLPSTQPYDTGFLLILSGLTLKGINYRLSHKWLYLWMGWWWLISFVLTLAYTCNLVAFLTVNVPASRIETIEELANSDIMISMEDYGNFVHEALKTSTDESLSKIGARLGNFTFDELGPLLTGPVSEGTLSIINGVAYHYFIRDYFNVTADTYFMKEELYPSYLVYYLKKNTPHTTLLSENLQRLVEADLIKKAYNHHMMKDDPPAEGDSLQALTVSHLSAAFIFCIAGYGVATLCLLLELLLAKGVSYWELP
ncbi:Ionotropic glutamate receptor [Trinorchestia longiramus]|nr:Ionotropic glutamate receptor [Trinorchestia longiramus]